MKVELIAVTKYLRGERTPEELLEHAGRVCYRSKSRGDPGKFLQARIREGHESIIEHACLTYEISGISRACSHQLVRHRLASYSQESQRYVRLDTGKETPWSKFTKAEEQEIIELYNAGKSTVELGRRYGCSQQTIANIVQRKGYTIRPRGDHKAGRLDVFEPPISDGIEAQLLGLLFADGYVFHDESSNSYRIGLKMKESHLVRQAQRILGSPGWRYTTDELTTTILCSSTIYDRLVNIYGCVPGKSSVMKGTLLSRNLPDKMLPHFMRGYFEGDGSIGRYEDTSTPEGYKVQVTFVSGSKSFLEWCESVIREHCNTRAKTIGEIRGGKGYAYRLQYQGIREIGRLLKWLYTGMDMQLCHWSKFVLAAEIFPEIWNLGRDAAMRECERLQVVCPPSILEQPQSAVIFLEGVQTAFWAYEDLKGFATAEDRRFLLPNATATRIVVTMNFRELLHVFRLRISPAAQWEIRDVCVRMLELAYPIAPNVFGGLREELRTKYPSFFDD